MYLEIRISKGYTDEQENLTRDHSRHALTVMLKDATTKKMRLRMTGYSQGEYYYAMLQCGLIMQYKNYGITKDKNIAA